MYLNEASKLIGDIYATQVETGERFSVELVSGPGIGKSAVVKQVAEILGKRMGIDFGFKPFFLTTVEPPDVRGFGLPGKDDDGNLIMNFTQAPWMPRKDEPANGFVFLDEFAQAQSDVAKPAAELLLNGQVGDSRLPIEWMVLAASNREKDRSGVGRGLAFIENRKCRILIEPHLDSWVEWAEKMGINPFAVAFAKTRPALIFKDAIPSEPGPFATPRTLVKVSHLIGRLTMEHFNAVAAGYLGDGAAAELIAFLRVADELPKFEEIVSNPKKCRLPEKRPDAQYACMQLVAHRVDKKTAVPAFEYLMRMPKEFQVAGLKATLRRVPEMLRTPDFAAWLRDNKDLVMAANALETK
jgi:hypothetical protein